MYLKRICFPVKVLGPGQRIGIWVTGCSRRCSGCMSPELQKLEAGRDIPVEVLLRQLEHLRGRADGVTISGGEPFLQAGDLLRLVEGIRQRICTDIIVYTGYTLEQLRKQRDPDTDRALELISVLIDGPYVDELNDGKGLRGSSNQRVHILRGDGDYSQLEQGQRTLQSIRYDHRILMIGIQ